MIWNNKISSALLVTLFLFAATVYLNEGADGELSRNMPLSLAHASFLGASYSDYSGISADICGDVNGDGYDDLLIGASGNDESHSSAGKTYLFFGRSSGFSIDMGIESADASFLGEEISDGSGASVSGVGDANGDGYDDIVIGAPTNDDGGSNSGKTYLIFGKPTGWSTGTDLSDADVSFYGEASYDQSGEFVAGAGDVNGDGYDDILIGTDRNDEAFTNAGKVYLIFGRSTGWQPTSQLSIADASFRGEAASNGVGRSIGAAGDVNGDGYDDLLIGASENDEGGNNIGQSYLILGGSTGWMSNISLSSSDASFRGESIGDQAGNDVSDAGDVNGDGYDDFLIGAQYDDDTTTDSGQVYIIFGRSSGWLMDTSLSTANASFLGENSGDRLGYSVAGAGDIDDDGYDDLIFSSRFNDDSASNAGKTYLVLGKETGWSMDTALTGIHASFLGEEIDDYAGTTVGGGGDVNGDGYDDIIICSPYNDEVSTSSGQTYLILPNAAPPTPRNLDAFPGSDGSSITVTWDRPLYWNRDVSSYRVLRSTDGTNYHLVHTSPSTTRTYLDNDVTIGMTYYYAVSAVFLGGEVSRMSPAFSIFCDRDFDGDGLGDAVDTDDDNDGIPDVMDFHKWGRDPINWGSYNVNISSVGRRFYGESVGDSAGLSMDLSGDVNGDGIDDLIIGSHGNDEGGTRAGKVYLFFGRTGGWSDDVNLSSADASFIGEGSDDRAGISATISGDVNGDGYDDIIIGADEYEPMGGERGRAYIIFGKSSGWRRNMPLSRANVRLQGEDNENEFGRAVASGGDINGDGYDDILIGAPRHEVTNTNFSGKAYLVLGRSSFPNYIAHDSVSASYFGADDDGHLGCSLALDGDLDGDGLDDMIIGEKFHRKTPTGTSVGKINVILGRRSGWSRDRTLTHPDASYIGERGHAGWSVACPGDVNGDGLDDMLIGAPDDWTTGSQSGQTYLVFGKTGGWTRNVDFANVDASFHGENSYDRSGYYVDGAGDVNDDGFDDIIIGAPNQEYGGYSSPHYAGKTYIIFGGRTGWKMDLKLEDASISFYGETGEDSSGYVVAGGGDPDNDGRADVMIGAWTADHYGLNTGTVYLLEHREFDIVTDLSTEYREGSQGIYISWNDTHNGTVAYGIYRGVSGGGIYRIANTTGSNYTDWDISLGITYSYYIVTLDPFGTQSPLSRPIDVLADKDSDEDGIGNLMDWDDDGDGYPDGEDDFPLNASEWLDTDLDGVGNNFDTDDDNDGLADTIDSDPLNPLNAISVDIDLSTLYDMVIDLERNITSDLVYVEGNLSSRLNAVQNSLSGRIDGLNVSLMQGMEDQKNAVIVRFEKLHELSRQRQTQHWEDMNGSFELMTEFFMNMNSNITEDILEILNDLDSIESKLIDPTSILDEIEALSAQMDDWMVGLDQNMSERFQNIAASMGEMQQDILLAMDSGLSELETILLLEISLLKGYIEIVNQTLHYHLDSLEDLFGELGISVDEAFTLILEDNSQNRVEMISILLNFSSGDGTSVSENISRILTHVEGIETSVHTLDQIDEMITSIESIEQVVIEGGDEGGEGHDEYDDEDGQLLILILLIVSILCFILLVILLVIIVRKGREEMADETEEPVRSSPPLKR